ncbi:MAG: sugar ABC transporter substrate-binding protein [Actinomycetota bacterium]|nr:sugar ABC transporter substrate-binding protein [Actinomycetota bacterium]
MSRREALRLAALGFSGLAATSILTGCGRVSGAVSASSLAPVRALARFDASRPAGPRTGLPRRVAWANTSDTEIFVALGRGIETGAGDRGLEYLTAVAANDPAKNVDQMETFLARGVGGLAVQPLDQAAQRPVLARALRRGVCVQGIITFPSVLQIAASQYRIGYTQGRAAAVYALANLGGRADVVYFNQDRLSQQLRLRHRGVLDGLRTAGGGVRVVSDLSANEGDGSIEGGFTLMDTVFERHPGIKIVLGSDTLVTGAYRALQQTGRLSGDMYLSGVDGDSNALELVKQGGPYRASLAFSWGLMGYGLGRFAADWIDGKEIPRVMIAKSIVLDSRTSVDAYLAANADPAGVFADRERYERYLPLLGNVGHATRHAVWRQEYVPA